MNTNNNNTLAISAIIAALPIIPISLAFLPGTVAFGMLIIAGLAGLGYIEVSNQRTISSYSKIASK